MSENKEFHVEELIGAYALGALEPDERLLVDVHLQSCATCATSAERASRVAGLLPYATEPLQPPKDLEERLMARLADARGPTVVTPEHGQVVSIVEKPPARRSRVWTLARRALPLVAAFAIVLGLASWNVRLQSELAHQTQIEALISRAEVRDLAADTSAPAAAGRVYVDRASGQTLLAVSGLPDLPSDRTYQFWFVRPDGVRDSGGTLRADGGTATLLTRAPAGLDAYVGVGVTTEPAGGSLAPTGPRVIGARL